MDLNPTDAATRRRARRAVVLMLAAVVAAAIAATPAAAELSQKGDLFIRFDGGISPTALPREGLAPVGVRIEGTIRALHGKEPPGVRRISIALNRGGRIDTRGLPVCRRGRIAAADPAEALAACGNALVGAGGIVARTSLAGQTNATLRGNLLLFNARVGGRPAILAHLHTLAPAPGTDLITFHIRHARGAFGTVVTARIPPALNRNGYLKSIFFRLQRSYSFRGRRRSYLSAGCAAPRGFPGAVFPFARASMTFDDGRTLSATLVRSCRVRG